MALSEEIPTPAPEESAPLPQAETTALGTQTTLPEASVVEGK
jgi:hypothetical protein